MVSKKGIHAFLGRTFRSHSEAETLALGEALGKELGRGEVVALAGEIGSGKTVFIKGLSRGLGVKNPDEVKSPTFVLMHLYEGRMPVQHFDLYRLERESELEAIGFDDFLAQPKAVSVIEWADRVEKRIPPGATWVKLFVSGARERKIQIRHSR